MFELIRRDKTDRQAGTVVRLLNDAAECLHAARSQADALSPDIAEQIAQAFATVDALWADASGDWAHTREQKGER